MRPGPRVWLALSAPGLLALVAWTAARADPVDPATPIFAAAGRHAAPAVAERLDAERSGRSPVALPDAAALVWQRQLGGVLEHSPVVTAGSTIVSALVNGDLVWMSAAGSETARVRLPAQAATAPVVISDGTVVVLTTNARVVGVRPSGRVRFDVQLSIRARDADVAPVPLADGSVAFASGRDVAIAGLDGTERARWMLPERAAGMVEAPRGLVLVTDGGDVWLLHAPEPPRRVGNVGGTPRRGIVLASPRTVAAVVDNRNVGVLDLHTGRTTVRQPGSASGQALDGPPIVAGPRRLLVATVGGLAIRFDPEGDDVLHAAFERQAIPAQDAGVPMGGFFSQELKPSPPFVVDPAGRIAFARATGKIGLVSVGGDVTVIHERLCANPVAVVPVERGKLAVACKDGSLSMFASAE